MGKYILVATSNVKEGQEAEHAKWHDEIHTPDLCSLPGVTSGRRFVVHPATPAPTTNMSIYEIETDDPVAVLAELGKRVQSGEFTISSAIDPTGSGMALYQQA